LPCARLVRLNPAIGFGALRGACLDEYRGEPDEVATPCPAQRDHLRRPDHSRLHLVGGDTPDVNDDPGKITSFWADHHDKQYVAAALVALGAVFLAIFVASLRERTRSADGESDFWSNLVLIGGSVAVAGFLVAVGFHVALADGGDHHFSADAMVALNALDNDSFFAFGIPIGIMLLGSGAATIKAGPFPGWLGWVAVVLGIAAFTPVGFVSFGLSGIWIIIASILMSRSAAPASPAAG
jgi:hypothetical protein